jgi:hypothetical protein
VSICVRVPPKQTSMKTLRSATFLTSEQKGICTGRSRDLHSIVEVADFLKQPGNASSISRDVELAGYLEQTGNGSSMSRDEVVQILGHGTL